MSSDQEPITDQADREFLDGLVRHLRRTLSESHYDGEIDSALGQLEFNIVIMGSPPVGKSELINALSKQPSLAPTSPSLSSCTQKVKKYVLLSHQLPIKDLPPITINVFDTPGVESWQNGEGEQTILKFIEETNPVCVIFCASPGCFSPLERIHFLLRYCLEKHLICAMVCTNMWSDNKRNNVIDQFKRELRMFGTERVVDFPQIHSPKPHRVTFFGNAALCMMGNSIEYVDEDKNFRAPEQGVDELINCIMELLDDKKLLGWCIAVLHRRSFWQKLSQQTTGFVQLRFKELKSIPEKPASEIAYDVLMFTVNAYFKAR